jgi:hypothetical protein
MTHGQCEAGGGARYPHKFGEMRGYSQGLCRTTAPLSGDPGFVRSAIALFGTFIPRASVASRHHPHFALKEALKAVSDP